MDNLLSLVIGSFAAAGSVVGCSAVAFTYYEYYRSNLIFHELHSATKAELGAPKYLDFLVDTIKSVPAIFSYFVDKESFNRRSANSQYYLYVSYGRHIGRFY